MIKIFLIKLLLVHSLDTNNASNTSVNPILSDDASETLITTHGHIYITIGKLHSHNRARICLHQGVVLAIPKCMITHMDIAGHNCLRLMKHTNIDSSCAELLIDEWPYACWFPILIILSKGRQY